MTTQILIQVRLKGSIWDPYCTLLLVALQVWVYLRR